MKKNKIKFNYKNLRSLDIVHCAGRSPMATATRIVTAGWENWKNHDIAVHTGILVSFHGQLLIAEMQSKGLEINSLEKYNKIGGKRWVIDIVRYNFAKKDKYKVLRDIAKDRRRTIEYDWKGIIEFVNNKVDDNKQKNYCSEYVYEVTKEFIPYPVSFAYKVSPYDLQKLKHLKSVDWKI